jgi:HlyD family secretion protein
MKRKYFIIIIVVIALALIPVLLNITSDEPEQLIKVKVERNDFNITVKTTGELQAENSEMIKGPSLRKVGIHRVQISDLVPEGELVDSGDYVAELDRSEIVRKYDEVEEQLQKVQSQYENTQLDTALELRQLRDNLINLRYSMEEAQIALDESQYESPATIRQSTISLEKSKRAYKQSLESYDLKVEQKKANMLEVSINLNQQKRKLQDIIDIQDQFTIYAPKSGMVIYRREWGGQKRKVGSEVSNWDPTVATLPDMSSMISRTYVNEIDISKLNPDQKVKVEIDAFPGKEYSAIVTEVANVGEDMPNSDAKVFEVMIKILAIDTILRPNMTSSNTITVADYVDVLSVPLEAIHNNDSLTYVIKDRPFGRVKQIIEVGESNENAIIITDGLNEGETVYMTITKDADNLAYEGLEIYERIKERKRQAKEEAERKLKEARDTIGKEQKEFDFSKLPKGMRGKMKKD